MKFTRHLSLTVVVAIAAFALGGAYLFAMTQIQVPIYADPIGARAFPFLIGLGMLISGVVLVFEHIQARKTAVASTASPAEEWPALSWTVIGVAVWTAAYLAVFEWLGFLVSTVLYLIPLMIYFDRKRPIVNVVVSIGFTVAAYFGLVVALGAQLPMGTLFQLFGY